MNKARSIFRGITCVLLLVVLLTACGEKEKKPEDIVIGYSMPQQIDEFQINLTEGLQSEADALGIQLVLVDSQNDPAKQAGDMEDLIVQKVDLIIVAPMDADAIVPSVEKANEAGIPVMTIDRGSNGGEILSHSAVDNYCFSYRSIEYISELLGGEGKLLVLQGTPGMTVVNWNIDGANDAIETTGLELAALLHADWDTANALAITEDTLTTDPDLAGIYAGYDTMAVGAVQALKARDLAGEVVVVSGGYTEEAQAFLKTGEMKGDVEIQNKQGARNTLRAGYEYLVNGVEPPKWTSWPMIMHTFDGEEYVLDCPVGDWSP